MKGPFGVVPPAIAVVATFVAIDAGPNYSVALPMSVIAVTAALFTAADALARTAHRTPPRSSSRGGRTGGLREWFLRGRIGREQIVLLLDRLDRAGDRPTLPLRSSEEIEGLVRLPDAEFRAFVRRRLDAIEGEA
ncbi:MAG TPA: hypothetical protein VLX64_06260 [Thermoplasmata archaeon]|nr:hypothetical protein [Thermoplasmata archaeon]